MILYTELSLKLNKFDRLERDIENKLDQLDINLSLRDFDCSSTFFTYLRAIVTDTSEFTSKQDAEEYLDQNSVSLSELLSLMSENDSTYSNATTEILATIYKRNKSLQFLECEIKPLVDDYYKLYRELTELRDLYNQCLVRLENSIDTRADRLIFMNSSLEYLLIKSYLQLLSTKGL